MGRGMVAIVKDLNDGYIKVIKDFEVVISDVGSGALWQKSIAIPKYDGYFIQSVELLRVEATHSCRIRAPGGSVFGLSIPDSITNYLWANFAFDKYDGKNNFRFTSNLIYARKQKEYSIIRASCMYSLESLNIIGTGIQYESGLSN